MKDKDVVCWHLVLVLINSSLVSSYLIWLKLFKCVYTITAVTLISFQRRNKSCTFQRFILGGNIVWSITFLWFPLSFTDYSTRIWQNDWDANSENRCRFHTYRKRDSQTEGGREGKRERENSKSKTLFYKDCSLGSVKSLSNN